MAIETNTQLKDRVATGINTSVLFNNMIDSLGHPQDSSGNDVLTQHTNIGNVFDSSKWGASFYSLDIGATGSYYIDLSGNKITGSNMYHDGTDPRFKTSGYASFTQETKSNGETTDFVSSASGSADGIITWVETKKTDSDGNIAYNGATIPATLSSSYDYTFNTFSTTMIHSANGSRYVSTHIYYNGTNWTLQGTGTVNYTVLLQDFTGNIIEYAGTGTGGSTIGVLNSVKQTDANGNIAYNGATIPADVDPDWHHIFYTDTRVKITHATSAFTTYETENAYVKENNIWQHVTTGKARRSTLTNTVIVDHISSTTTGAVTFVEQRRLLEEVERWQAHLFRLQQEIHALQRRQAVPLRPCLWQVR